MGEILRAEVYLLRLTLQGITLARLHAGLFFRGRYGYLAHLRSV